MKKKIAFIFQHSPYGSNKGRELLDLAMVSAAYEQDIYILFLGEGIYQVLEGQAPSSIACKNHSKTFAALPLYDIEHFYVCSQSLAEAGRDESDLLKELDFNCRDHEAIRELIADMDEVILS